MASTTMTERTVYVAVLVVEHTPGTGKQLDDGDGWPTGVRANLVTWLDGVLTRNCGEIDDNNFYAVRDVTLYSDEDLVAELRDHGTIDKFPDVDMEA